MFSSHVSLVTVVEPVSEMVSQPKIFVKTNKQMNFGHTRVSTHSPSKNNLCNLNQEKPQAPTDAKNMRYLEPELLEGLRMPEEELAEMVKQATGEGRLCSGSSKDSTECSGKETEISQSNQGMGCIKGWEPRHAGAVQWKCRQN